LTLIHKLSQANNGILKIIMSDLSMVLSVMYLTEQINYVIV
jgi:hypothetical protein